MLNPIADIGERIGQLGAGAYNTFAHPIETYTNAANSVVSVYNRANRGLQGAGLHATASQVLAFGTATAYAGFSVTGGTQLAEGVYGEDFATGLPLSTLDRWTLGLGGLGNLALLGAGAVGELGNAASRGVALARAETAVSAGDIERVAALSGAIREYVVQEGTAEAVGGCFPAGTPVMLVASEEPQTASVWSQRLRYWAIGAAISGAAVTGWYAINRKPTRARRVEDELPPDEREPLAMPLPVGHGGWASFFSKVRIAW